MPNLLGAWATLEQRLSAVPHVCVLSDFDGTLVPLADHPDTPRLPDRAREILRNLSRLPNVTVGVVSGRSLEDVAARVELSGVWYVGNHGFEIRSTTGEEWRFFGQEDLACLEALGEDLKREAAGIPGVFLEPKGPVLAIHYRQVEPALIPQVEKACLRGVSRYLDRLMLERGHMVLEARVRSSCNKGTAVRLIQRRLPRRTLVIYFGDDLTDRHVFRLLQPWGVTVEVGPPESLFATFTLPDPDRVMEALERIRDQMSRDTPDAVSQRKPWPSS